MPEQPSPANVAAWAVHLSVAPADIDVAALRAELTKGTIPEILAETAASAPDASLTIGGRVLTYRNLHESTRRRAAVLAARGLRPDDRVVISAASSLELVTTYLAALHAGLVAVLVDPDHPDSELGAVVERANAALFVTARPRNVKVATLSLDELAARGADATPIEAVPRRPHDVALLAFTSGTTGRPKGVPLTHAHLLSSIRAAMWAWKWQESDVLVHALPLFHQHGLSGLHASLVAGTGATILAKFDAEDLVRTVDEANATVLFGVPAIHRRLVDLPIEKLRPLRRLRIITSGSGPLSLSLAQAFTETTGVELLERYGLTESGLDVSNPYDGPRVPGSVGLPLPGVELRLADGEGNDVGPGEVGEIVLRGPQVFDGYLDDEDATRKAFWGGGWFRTGDLGRFDEAGRLRISGRLKDLVITGGMNVSPVEVESVVEQVPGVEEAAVAGLPSEKWGEEVAVWIVPVAGRNLHPDQVMAHCRSRLASYKCPKRVFVVDALPRNAMGKVVRSELTASFRDDQGDDA